MQILYVISIKRQMKYQVTEQSENGRNLNNHTVPCFLFHIAIKSQISGQGLYLFLRGLIFRPRGGKTTGTPSPDQT